MTGSKAMAADMQATVASLGILVMLVGLDGPMARLLQPLVQAMALGSTADEVARTPYWIHPALMEVVENALLDAEV